MHTKWPLPTDPFVCLDPPPPPCARADHRMYSAPSHSQAAQISWLRTDCTICLPPCVSMSPPPPPVPSTARPSALAVPPLQIEDTALTSLSVPVLASVVGNFWVRHTHPPASHTSCLPCVRFA
eukprot:scaffold5326_cov136-Isochrysis_galbana.AAC.7